MDDFEKELKSGFLDEAAQLMVDTEQCFLALESAAKDPVILEKIFRLAHNLKGSAKAVGFDELGSFTHELESYLLRLKNGDLQITAAAITLLLKCNDHVLKMIQALQADFGSLTDCRALLSEIHEQMSGSVAPKVAAAPSIDLPVDSPVEEEPSKLSIPSVPEVAFPAEFHLPEPLQKTVSAKTPAAAGGAPSDESIRVSLNRLEKLINFVGEMVILQTVLREQIQSSNSLLLRKTVHQLGKVTKEIQDISMSLRMVPLKQTFQKMQRIVRDTSATLDKKVQLNLQGEETELDKTILESLGDPLVHLIRNAVDHGVESPEIRRNHGKPETGTILLRAFHKSGSLIIEIKDDGAGLDAEKLKAKAVEKGILKSTDTLSNSDAYQLIFHSGFSTKAVVTDVSGRGVGMDVVRTNIQKLQGEITIETELGKGTCFTIRLPLTLAIIDAMVILCEKERYVVPLSHVHESVKPQTGDISFVTGMGELYCLRGESLPLYRLSQLLGKKSARLLNECIAIVIRTGKEPFSVLVDDILGQFQVVIKKLGEEHSQLKGFSGSAILGDGRPALILELPELATRHKPIAFSASVPSPSPPSSTPENRSAAA